jgi:hypothetical protein
MTLGSGEATWFHGSQREAEFLLWRIRMSKASLYKWIGLTLGATALATAGSCNLQGLVQQILGGLTGA